MIKCDDYDYVEIVCLFRYPIRLILCSGEIIEGVAKDTKRNADREECIAIALGEQTQLVVLEHIAELEVLVDNPHFQHLSLSAPRR